MSLSSFIAGALSALLLIAIFVVGCFTGASIANQKPKD